MPPLINTLWTVGASVCLTLLTQILFAWEGTIGDSNFWQAIGATATVGAVFVALGVASKSAEQRRWEQRAVGDLTLELLRPRMINTLTFLAQSDHALRRIAERHASSHTKLRELSFRLLERASNNLELVVPEENLLNLAHRVDQTGLRLARLVGEIAVIQNECISLLKDEDLDTQALDALTTRKRVREAGLLLGRLIPSGPRFATFREEIPNQIVERIKNANAWQISAKDL